MSSSPRVVTPRTKERVQKTAGNTLRKEALTAGGLWYKKANDAEREQFGRVFDRLEGRAATTTTTTTTTARSGSRGGTRSPVSHRREGLLGTRASLASNGSTFERSTYTNDFRQYATSAKPSAIIPQTKHTRLDDFDQRVPPSTYRGDFVNHMADQASGDRLAPDQRLLEATASLNTLRAMSRGPPQSMYNTDFHNYTPEERQVSKVEQVQALHGKKTVSEIEDPDVRKFLLTSVYQTDFVEHTEAKVAELAAAAEADVDPLAIEAAKEAQRLKSIYQTSFRNKGNPGSLRGATVRSLYAPTIGGLPGVPDLSGDDVGQSSVRRALLTTTYDSDFAPYGATAESLQPVYGDLVSDAAKARVAHWIANEATDEEKEEFRAVFGKMREEMRQNESTEDGAIPRVGGHKFFV